MVHRTLCRQKMEATQHMDLRGYPLVNVNSLRTGKSPCYSWVNQHFSWVNQHFSWVNQHFSWVNQHFQWVNQHFQWVNQHV